MCQCGELRPTNGWDPSGSLRHPCKFQRVSCLGSVNERHSSSGCQPNFAAFNRGRHLYSAGRPLRWALADILAFCCIAGLLRASITRVHYTGRLLSENDLYNLFPKFPNKIYAPAQPKGSASTVCKNIWNAHNATNDLSFMAAWLTVRQFDLSVIWLHCQLMQVFWIHRRKIWI